MGRRSAAASATCSLALLALVLPSDVLALRAAATGGAAAVSSAAATVGTAETNTFGQNATESYKTGQTEVILDVENEDRLYSSIQGMTDNPSTPILYKNMSDYRQEYAGRSRLADEKGWLSQPTMPLDASLAAGEQYLIMDLGRPMKVLGVVLAGRGQSTAYVTGFKVFYGTNMESMTFAGSFTTSNRDQKKYYLDQAVWGQHVKVQVRNYSGHCGMRAAAIADTEASALGDPHVQRADGTSFDIKKTGHHELLRIPRGGAPKLHLLCEINRLGEYCANTYITELHIKGQWTNDAPDLRFLARAQFKGNSTDSLKIEKDMVEFHAHGVRIRIDRVRNSGKPYLNLRIAGVHGMEAGGLLGQDDYSEVTIDDPSCRPGRPRSNPMIGASLIVSEA